MPSKPKKQAKTPTPPNPGTDASMFSAIHWFALVIEAKAIEIYATDADTYTPINEILTTAILALNGIKIPHAAARAKGGKGGNGGGGICPPGYMYCDEIDRCCPTCGVFDDGASNDQGQDGN